MKYIIAVKEENIPEDNDLISLVVGKKCDKVSDSKILILTCANDIPENLPGSTDLIVSWIAPLSFPPILERKTEETYEDFERRKSDRRKLDKLLKEGRHKWWFYPSESDKNYSGNYGDLKYRGLKDTAIFKL